MRQVNRFLPLQARVGGGVPSVCLPVFTRVEQMMVGKKKDHASPHRQGHGGSGSGDRAPASCPPGVGQERVLHGAGDNTSAAQLRAVLQQRYSADEREASYALFEGTYHNFLALYSSLARDYERRAARHITHLKQHRTPLPAWSELYLEYRRMMQDRAEKLDRLMLAINEEGTAALGLTNGPRQAPDAPLARLVSSALQRARIDKPDDRYDGVLLGSHSFIALKSAAQYELKGLRIEKLGRIKGRYNVFLPTRKEYLTLFTRALERNSVHYLDLRERQCLDIGSGTGVLSFLLHTHGALHVTGADINDDAILNAIENRSLLGISQDRVSFMHADLFPEHEPSKYDLIVCNPPWIPISVEENRSTGLMSGVLDPGGSMLTLLFQRIRNYLSAQGRFWLIYSNLAEKMGFQDESWLSRLCSINGLRLRTQTSIRSQVRLHPQDPFNELKKDELITLYDIELCPK